MSATSPRTSAPAWSIGCWIGRLRRRIRPQLDHDLDQRSDRPHAAARERSTLVNREGMQQYLRRSFQHNKPYDQMVFELISATRRRTSRAKKDFNGVVNFLARQPGRERRRRPRPRRLADLPGPASAMHAVPQPSVQRLEAESVLGDERLLPPDAGPAARRRGPRDRFGRAGQPGFRRRREQSPDEAVLFYELRNGMLKVAYPVFVDGTKIKSAAATCNRSIAAPSWPELIVGSDYLPQGDRQPHVGAFSRLWLHQAGRRHGAAQSAVASGIARTRWPRNSARTATT